jgi:hypothetical protein
MLFMLITIKPRETHFKPRVLRNGFRPCTVGALNNCQRAYYQHVNEFTSYLCVFHSRNKVLEKAFQGLQNEFYVSLYLKSYSWRSD